MKNFLARLIGNPEKVDLPPEKCIFCKIANGKHPDSRTIIYEDETLVVFPDIRPAGRAHYQVVTKRHIVNVGALRPGQQDYDLGE
jgi:diadenosine tetraphosphate (Ap4A) HIT family hydrolase